MNDPKRTEVHMLVEDYKNAPPRSCFTVRIACPYRRPGTGMTTERRTVGESERRPETWKAGYLEQRLVHIYAKRSSVSFPRVGPA